MVCEWKCPLASAINRRLENKAVMWMCIMAFIILPNARVLELSQDNVLALALVVTRIAQALETYHKIIENPQGWNFLYTDSENYRQEYTIGSGSIA